MGNCLKSPSITNSELPSKRITSQDEKQQSNNLASNDAPSTTLLQVYPKEPQAQPLQPEQPEQAGQVRLAEHGVVVLDSRVDDDDPLRCESDCSQNASKIANNLNSNSSHKDPEFKGSVNCQSLHLQAKSIHLSHTSSAILGKEQYQAQEVDNCSEGNEVMLRIDPTKSHLIDPQAEEKGLQLNKWEDLVKSQMIASSVLKQKQRGMKTTDETIRVEQFTWNNIEQSVVMIQTHKRD